VNNILNTSTDHEKKKAKNQKLHHDLSAVDESGDLSPGFGNRTERVRLLDLADQKRLPETLFN
jgi:hypothetical protein